MFQSNEVIIKSGIKYPKNVAILKNKDPEEAAQLLDYKVIDLQKKLDLMHHETKQVLKNLIHIVISVI